ncbi:MAG: cache domain-containing protein, partial [Treponema sp.]
MAQRFSLKNKLVLIFGALIAVASLIEGFFAIHISRNAVTEKVGTHLTDKAEDVAEIIDGRITSFFQYLEGIARMPEFQDPNVPFSEKRDFLRLEVEQNDVLSEASITDPQGNMYHNLRDDVSNIRDIEWFRTALNGGKFFMEPYNSRGTGKLVVTFAIPVYDNNRSVIGVLAAATSASWLSAQITDIVVGKTGYCYVLGRTGNIVAHHNSELVEKHTNAVELAKSDSSYAELASLIQTAFKSDKSAVGYYNYKGKQNIAAFARIKNVQWEVIITAPKNEFLGTVNALRVSMFIIGGVILVIAVAVVFLTARAIIKPIQTTVSALRNIAQGEGDLTVRLPVTGNDEITDLSEYFNQTITKIGDSIRAVGASSKVMEGLGEELSSDMTETASAINEISSNIDGVKQQAMTQAASVT